MPEAHARRKMICGSCAHRTTRSVRKGAWQYEARLVDPLALPGMTRAGAARAKSRPASTFRRRDGPKFVRCRRQHRLLPTAANLCYKSRITSFLETGSPDYRGICPRTIGLTHPAGRHPQERQALDTLTFAERSVESPARPSMPNSTMEAGLATPRLYSSGTGSRMSRADAGADAARSECPDKSCGTSRPCGASGSCAIRVCLHHKHRRRQTPGARSAVPGRSVSTAMTPSRSVAHHDLDERIQRPWTSVRFRDVREAVPCRTRRS